MLKFILGAVFGALVSILYVHYNLQLPAVMQVPDLLRGNFVATATESKLYDLDADEAGRMRALEVYFANRPHDAAKIDAAFGHPFLIALHRERASRKALQLSSAWGAFDKLLANPELRAKMSEKFATNDTETLKRTMLIERLDRQPYLKRWLEKNGDSSGSVTSQNLYELLQAAKAYPTVLANEPK